MKKIFLLLVTALFFNLSFTNGQYAKTQSEMNMAQLEVAVTSIVKSKSTQDIKQARLLKAIAGYLTTIQSNDEPQGMPNVVSDAKNCSKKQIMVYLEKFSIKKYVRLPQSYIASLGDIKNDCALQKAVEIYEQVGWKNIGSANLCPYLGCDDFRPTNTTKTRGAGEAWKYTGVKKYVLEDDFRGWLYLCVIETRDSQQKAIDNEDFRIAIENDMGYIREKYNSGDKSVELDFNKLEIISKEDLKWKQERNVTKW